jgi:hypothetical protein
MTPTPSPTDQLIASLTAALRNRHAAVDYLAPEKFDSAEHEEAFSAAQEAAGAVLAVAEKYLKEKGLS